MPCAPSRCITSACRGASGTVNNWWFSACARNTRSSAWRTPALSVQAAVKNTVRPEYPAGGAVKSETSKAVASAATSRRGNQPCSTSPTRSPTSPRVEVYAISGTPCQNTEHYCQNNGHGSQSVEQSGAWGLRDSWTCQRSRRRGQSGAGRRAPRAAHDMAQRALGHQRSRRDRRRGQSDQVGNSNRLGYNAFAVASSCIAGVVGDDGSGALGWAVRPWRWPLGGRHVESRRVAEFHQRLDRRPRRHLPSAVPGGEGALRRTRGHLSVAAAQRLTRSAGAAAGLRGDRAQGPGACGPSLRRRAAASVPDNG